MPKLLGLDVGERRIGTAVADTSLGIAFPRVVIMRDQDAAVFVKIGEMCKAEKVDTIIVGEPLGEENEETPRSVAIHAFASELGKTLVEKGLTPKIEFVDESFSSKEATSRIPLKRDRKVKGADDPIAAAILLERYMRTL